VPGWRGRAAPGTPQPPAAAGGPAQSSGAAAAAGCSCWLLGGGGERGDTNGACVVCVCPSAPAHPCSRMQRPASGAAAPVPLDAAAAAASAANKGGVSAVCAAAVPLPPFCSFCRFSGGSSAGSPDPSIRGSVQRLHALSGQIFCGRSPLLVLSAVWGARSRVRSRLQLTFRGCAWRGSKCTWSCCKPNHHARYTRAAVTARSHV
jgi:hypothetical protein